MIEIITEADYKDRLAATQNGVLLFFKKLCPHCKNMEKVLEKFGAAKSGIALYGIDIEENAAAAAARKPRPTPAGESRITRSK